MKNLIGAVLVLLMSAPVVADHVAVSSSDYRLEETSKAWVVVDDDIYFCETNSFGEGRNVKPYCWLARKAKAPLD